MYMDIYTLILYIYTYTYIYTCIYILRNQVFEVSHMLKNPDVDHHPHGKTHGKIHGFR